MNTNDKIGVWSGDDKVREKCLYQVFVINLETNFIVRSEYVVSDSKENAITEVIDRIMLPKKFDTIIKYISDVKK